MQVRAFLFLRTLSLPYHRLIDRKSSCQRANGADTRKKYTETEERIQRRMIKRSTFIYFRYSSDTSSVAGRSDLKSSAIPSNLPRYRYNVRALRYGRLRRARKKLGRKDDNYGERRFSWLVNNALLPQSGE